MPPSTSYAGVDMTDAPARPATGANAIREFEGQIERLIDILVGAINRAANLNIDIDDFLDPEDHPTDKAKAIVDRGDFKAFESYLETLGWDINEGVEDAVKNFLWELNRARRALHEALR